MIAPSGVYNDYVLANPPFGKKSSQTFTNEEGEQEKEHLTYNRQQQATELRSAHPLYAKDNRQGGSSCSGQRVV